MLESSPWLSMSDLSSRQLSKRSNKMQLNKPRKCRCNQMNYWKRINYYDRQEPENKVEYGQGYYQQHIRNMRQGYVHPYHSEKYPLVFSYYGYLKTVFEAAGPEQVSPHYEALSRSRKGLLFVFFYIGTINTVSRMGGWAHNEWIRAMIWHHEYLIAFYLGYIETRHFTYFTGPKFTTFYNVYARYEIQ